MQNSLLWLVLLFAVMYFVMIRPQQKQKKQRDQLLSNLKKGEEIITIGGIHGKIMSLTDDNIVLEISPKVRITIQRSAVGIVKKDDDEDAAIEADKPETGKVEQLEEKTGDDK